MGEAFVHTSGMCLYLKLTVHSIISCLTLNNHVTYFIIVHEALYFYSMEHIYCEGQTYLLLFFPV